jgi:2-keto-4-pentenoate hydratase/2-oxohepta-3-ene-1,7-dioic acid hydratase in catechol pathway
VVVVVGVVVTTRPSFREALRAFESMRGFTYAHDISERDQANIVNIESLLFNFKRKGATKQMKINDFLKKNAKWT